MNLKQFNPMKILNHWETLNGLIDNKKVTPISCEIDVTNLCNHNCVWCMFEEFKKIKPESIPRDILFRLLDDLVKLKVKSVTFTGGGEPLVSPLLIEALYKAKRKGLEVGLATNGGLMNKGVCKAIIDSCMFLRVSLDAATKSTHTKLHRPKNSKVDNFDAIIKNLKYLLYLRKKYNKKLTVGIAFIVHDANYHESYKVAKLAKAIGADYVQIRPVYIPGKKLSDRVWFETQKLTQKAMRLSNKQFHVFPILHRFDEVKALERTYTKCQGHNLLAVVGGDCNLYLCCQLRGNPKFSFGSLKEKRFKDIWFGKKRQKVIGRINLSKCPPCRYNKYNELLDYLSDAERPHKNFL